MGLEHKKSAEILPPIEIPVSALNQATLKNLIDSFIFREGTDYGAQELEHQTKVIKVQKLLETGRIKIAYDPNSESVTILTENEWDKYSKNLLPEIWKSEFYL